MEMSVASADEAGAVGSPTGQGGAAGAVEREAERGAGAGGPLQGRRMVEVIKPDPHKMRDTSHLEAQRLATLPRSRFGEFVQNAFWASVTSVVGATAGYADLTSNKPSQPLLVDLAAIVLFCVSMAFLMFGIFSRMAVQTSEAYFMELYKIQPQEAGFVRRWLRQIVG